VGHSIISAKTQPSPFSVIKIPSLRNKSRLNHIATRMIANNLLLSQWINARSWDYGRANAPITRNARTTMASPQIRVKKKKINTNGSSSKRSQQRMKLETEDWKLFSKHLQNSKLADAESQWHRVDYEIIENLKARKKCDNIWETVTMPWI